MDDELISVTRQEVHHWPSCPCPTCVAERERRDTEPKAPTNRLIKLLSPEAAYLLHLIPKRSPGGSVARDLRERQDSSIG